MKAFALYAEFVSEIQNEANREAMLKQLMSYAFAENELALFLDTHPQDLKALEMHKSVAEKLKKLTDEYVQMHGPITTADAMGTDTWQWLEGKWPWEN